MRRAGAVRHGRPSEARRVRRRRALSVPAAGFGATGARVGGGAGDQQRAEVVNTAQGGGDVS